MPPLDEHLQLNALYFVSQLSLLKLESIIIPTLKSRQHPEFCVLDNR